jgi:hypothetical protein
MYYADPQPPHARRSRNARVRRQPTNPYWQDLRSISEDLALSGTGGKLPPREIIELLHEHADEVGRDGNAEALRLTTVHGAKGLECRRGGRNCSGSTCHWGQPTLIWALRDGLGLADALHQRLAKLGWGSRVQVADV